MATVAVDAKGFAQKRRTNAQREVNKRLQALCLIHRQAPSRT